MGEFENGTQCTITSIIIHNFSYFDNYHKLCNWPKSNNKKYLNAYEILKRIDYVLID